MQSRARCQPLLQAPVSLHRSIGIPHLFCPSCSGPLSPALDQLELSRISGREEHLASGAPSFSG